MKQVLLGVREDFAGSVHRAAFDALDASLARNEDLWISPRPSTTWQHGIFNTPMVMLGFHIAPEIWEERDITRMIMDRVQAMPNVSHTSALPNAHLYGDPAIEGLTIRAGDHFTKLSVTTNLDQHRGYVKAVRGFLHKKPEGSDAPKDALRRLQKEQIFFAQMQQQGHVPTDAVPAWEDDPDLKDVMAFSL